MKKLLALATLAVATLSSQAQVTPRTPVVPWGAKAETIITNDLTQQDAEGNWTLTDDAKSWISYSYDGSTESGYVQQTNRPNVWFDFYDESTDTMIVAANHDWKGYLTVTSKSGATNGLMVVGQNRYPSFSVTGTEKAKFYFSGSSGQGGYPQIEVYEDGATTPVATYTGDTLLTKKTWDQSTLLIADNLDKTKNYDIVARTMNRTDGTFTYDGGDIVLQVVKLYGDQAPLREDSLILSGSEIGGYISAYQAAKPGSHTFALEGNGKYTISQSIKTDYGFSLTGVADAPATIDADSLTKAFIILDGDTVHALNADSTVNSSYLYADKVEIANLNINNLQKALVQDNQKTLLDNITVDNVILKHAGGNANIFNFNGKGYPANILVKNSTLYSDTSNVHKGYFLQTGGRVRDLDGDQTKYKEVIDIENSTLSNIAVKQQFNNLRGKGQKSLSFILKNSILNETGTKNGAVIRGWLGGQASKNINVEYENNTYVTGDSISTEWTNASNDGADTTKTQLTTVPFKDGTTNFTVAASSQQAKYKTGDPRWLVEYATEGITIDVSDTLNTDFVAAVNEALATSEAPSRVTINFVAPGTYVTSGELNTIAPVTIQVKDIKAGKATIDARHGLTVGGDLKIDGVNIIADSLKTPVITLQGNPYKLQDDGFYKFGSIKLANFKASGMHGDFIYGNKVKNLVNEIETKNCQIYMGTKGKTVYNFNGGGVVGAWNFVKSTLDAANSTIFSSQSGTKATEAGLKEQTFNINGSSIINPGKKCFQHRQNSQKWLHYILKNSLILVNAEKPNFVSEMNAGSMSPNPKLDASGNAFQQLGGANNDSVFDVSGKQFLVNGDTIRTSLKGYMSYYSLTDPIDLGGTFSYYEGQEEPSTLGDPRWFIEFVKVANPTGIEKITDNNENVTFDPNAPMYNLAGQRVNKSFKGVVIQKGRKFFNK